ncbi:MAG: hypothetical protein ACE5K0_06490 [Candidatus Methanofastidiosia archaeon]
MDNKEVEYFVLVGDIFVMWRRDPLKVILENMDIIEKLAKLKSGRRNVYFLAGNHD